MSTPKKPQYLYHYTSDEGLAGILASQQLLPSRQEVADAQWGNGQYFTDISPLDAKSGSAHQLSRALFTLPWYHRRVKNWFRIDVSSLDIKKVTSVFSRTYGDRSIYLHPNPSSLNLVGRLDSYGPTPFKP